MLRTKTSGFFRRVTEKLGRIAAKKAFNNLQKNPGLWAELNNYVTKSQSIGCSYSDYWELYKFIRNNKPKEILECGTGVSTVILAVALKENENDGYPGRITSMEEDENWFHMAKTAIPKYFSSYVELIHSPRTEDYYSLFRGVRYRDVPDRPYDFVFVDGPDYVAPSDGTISFDFDFIYVVRKSEIPVYAIVDKRVASCYVFQKIFGLDKVKYDPVLGLGFVGPCTKCDLKDFNPKYPSFAFSDSFRLMGETELRLKF